MRSVRVVLGMVALVSVGSIHAQTCDPLPKGVVGWWPGDGNANDITLAADHGALINGTTFTTGVDGQAFLFDGVNDRVDVPDTPALRPLRFTLAAWVQTSSINACILCKQVGTGDADSFSLWISGGFLRGGMFRYAEAISTTAFVANRLQHVATTYDGSIIRLYLDGDLIALAPGPTTAVPYDTNPLILGAEDNGVGNYTGFLNGFIDEAQVFSRALSQCEIRAIVRARGRGECKGDADGDAFPDFQDDCPAVANAGQADADGDGVGDACDCAAADPLVFAQPGDYKGVRFDARDTLDWCGEPSLSGPATVYDVIRGDLDELPVGGATTECRSPCVPAPSGVQNWWPGDGSATALVGGVNGTLENGATIDAGLVRQSFRFDGVDDRVRTASISVPNAFSVSAWVNSDLVNQGAYRRVLENSFSTDFYIGTDLAGTGYKLIVKSPASPYGAANGGKIRPGEWQHLVGTYNGTTGTLYVDGVAVASDTFTAPGTVSLPVYVGVAATGGFGFKGRVDEPQIWNRALTATEVRALYDAGSAGQCKAALGGIDALWTTPTMTDGIVPATGHGFWYVLHGNNTCGDGTYGFQTNGTERVSAACN